MRIEFTIKHTGQDWLAQNDFITVSAPTLDELDIKVKNLLVEKEKIKKGEKAEIFMAFDNSTIPQWIRQYAQHYFNRVVEVEG